MTPKSKVIQILKRHDYLYIALCQDGSIWFMEIQDGKVKWTMIAEIDGNKGYG